MTTNVPKPTPEAVDMNNMKNDILINIANKLLKQGIIDKDFKDPKQKRELAAEAGLDPTTYTGTLEQNLKVRSYLLGKAQEWNMKKLTAVDKEQEEIAKEEQKQADATLNEQLKTLHAPKVPEGIETFKENFGGKKVKFISPFSDDTVEGKILFDDDLGYIISDDGKSTTELIDADKYGKNSVTFAPIDGKIHTITFGEANDDGLCMGEVNTIKVDTITPEVADKKSTDIVGPFNIEQPENFAEGTPITKMEPRPTVKPDIIQENPLYNRNNEHTEIAENNEGTGKKGGGLFGRRNRDKKETEEVKTEEAEEKKETNEAVAKKTGDFIDSITSKI